MPNVSVTMTPTIYGYARVSTVDQNPEMQILALRQAGCKTGNIYTDHGRSGMHVERPKLNQCLSRLQRGDMLVIWKLDRLGRNTRHLLQIVEDLQKRGVNFRCITQGLDTSTPMGTVIFTVCAAFAQYEHSLLLERTSEGRKLALKKGKKFGAPASLSKERKQSAVHMLKTGMTVDEIAVALEVSKSTIYRTLRERLPSRFPKSRKKRAEPMPQAEPPGAMSVSPEVDLLFDTDDQTLVAELEKQLGMTQWQAYKQVREKHSGFEPKDPAKRKATSPAKQKSIRALN